MHFVRIESQELISFGFKVCSNATRVFVEESVKEEFLEKVVGRTKSIRVGDPLEPQTQMGALISSEHLEKVLRYVQVGKDEVSFKKIIEAYSWWVFFLTNRK